MTKIIGLLPVVILTGLIALIHLYQVFKYVKTIIMKTNMKMQLATKVSLIMILITVIALAFSCKKSKDDITNADFAGKYNGRLAYSSYSEADTITIPSSTSAAIVMNSKTSVGSSYSINGTVSGNTVTIASQSVYIASLGASYTVTGTGTLSNKTLVISYKFVNSGNVSTNWTFTGTKN
jgi:hypothetical protein